MADELLAIMGDDGVFREYDSTYDITIHCESQKEQEAIMERLIGSVSRKEIDEMIAEIESYSNDSSHVRDWNGLQLALNIIHKYCDKEQKNV